MRFKTGLVVGLATGYVLGAKAGRERYEQIVRTWKRVSDSPPMRDITAMGQTLVDQVRNLAGDGIAATSRSIRQSVARSNGHDRVQASPR